MIFISGCPKSSLARSIVYDYFFLTVFVRENTVLAMGENDQLPDYEYAENVVLHLFEIKDGAKITTEVTVCPERPCLLQTQRERAIRFL